MTAGPSTQSPRVVAIGLPVCLVGLPLLGVLAALSVWAFLSPDQAATSVSALPGAFVFGNLLCFGLWPKKTAAFFPFGVLVAAGFCSGWLAVTPYRIRTRAS